MGAENRRRRGSACAWVRGHGRRRATAQDFCVRSAPAWDATRRRRRYGRDTPRPAAERGPCLHRDRQTCRHRWVRWAGIAASAPGFLEIPKAQLRSRPSRGGRVGARRGDGGRRRAHWCARQTPDRRGGESAHLLPPIPAKAAALRSFFQPCLACQRSRLNLSTTSRESDAAVGAQWCVAIEEHLRRAGVFHGAAQKKSRIGS